MKVLLDHNVPHKLRLSLSGHEVITAEEMGWTELENGELLRAAEVSGSAVRVTGDKNLFHQQNLRSIRLALVVLSTNNWNILKRSPSSVVGAVNAATPGSFQFVSIETS